MNYSIILFMTFFHLYLNQQYQLRQYFFLLDINHNLTLYYDNFDHINIFYSGRSESIDNSTYLGNGAHKLVFLLGESNINEMARYPTSIFIISKDFANKLENKHRNYKIFIIDVDQYSSSLYFRDSIFCLIGKKLDETLLQKLRKFIYSSIIICLIVFSLNKIMTKIISEDNRLSIHILINNVSIFLVCLIFSNGLGFIFDSLLFNNYSLNLVNLIFYSIIKGFYYSSMCFSLSGDMILSFNKNEKIFKKIKKGAIFCSIFLTILIKVFTYFNNLITELNLLYIKSILEHSVLLCCTIYFINKKFLPLYSQVKYEQTIDSELVQCLKFKFQRMLWLNVFMLIYNLFFIVSTSIEHDYIYSYIDNIKIHLSLQLFYESVFFIFFFIIFLPIKLPRYYYDKVIFNYEIYENSGNLRVNISKKRSISILTSKILKKITDNPIVFYNPYISLKNQFSSNGLYLGFAQ